MGEVILSLLYMQDGCPLGEMHGTYMSSCRSGVKAGLSGNSSWAVTKRPFGVRRSLRLRDGCQGPLTLTFRITLIDHIATGRQAKLREVRAWVFLVVSF